MLLKRFLFNCSSIVTVFVVVVVAVAALAVVAYLFCFVLLGIF